MTLPDSCLDFPLVVVDVETTGTNYKHGGVIDIGVIRVDPGQSPYHWRSLIKPFSPVPEFITQLTGISNQDVELAPTFWEVATELFELINGCVFVAHNARFDYAFIKEEFRRTGRAFSAKTLCTVKLSRALYPTWPSHKLSTLIEKFDLQVQNRHQALDDALATWQALSKMIETNDPRRVTSLIKQQLKRPSLPAFLGDNFVSELPEGPGVYIFEGANGSTLYVGKSINIRERVLSHFADDHRSIKELQMAQEVVNIRTIPTPGELGALVKESALIKSLMPIYNRMLRRKTELVVARIVINSEGYSTVQWQRSTQIETNQLDQIVGIYRSEPDARQALITLAKEYHLCHKLLNLEKTSSACFAHHLKICGGACVGKESPLEYELKLHQAFAKSRLLSWPFAGPISITEEDTQTRTATTFILDQWCLVGVAEQRDQSLEWQAQDRIFDLDTYKIFKRYLLQSENQKKIHLIEPRELTQLTVA